MHTDAMTTDSQLTDVRFTASDGVAIVGEAGGHGSGPTVLLLHGGGQTRHAWGGTMRTLIGGGYRVISYDARGHGDSGWSPKGAYSIASLAADLRTVLGSVTGPFALIGASLGGITALEAVADGVRPAAVVLVDIVLRPERKGVDRIRAFMLGNPDGFANLDAAVAAVTAYNPRRARSTDPRGLMRNLRRGGDGRLRWHWDPRLVREDVTQGLADMERIIQRLSTASSVPMLLVRGQHSDVVSDANVADFRRYIPWAEVRDVAGAGHMVAGDSNAAFTRDVFEYLMRYVPTGRKLPAGA